MFRIVNVTKIIIKSWYSYKRILKVATAVSTVVAISRHLKCALAEAEPTVMTSKELIKQSCLVSANSTTTLLTTTMSSIVDTSEKYKDTLIRMICLLEECLKINGTNNEMWDAVIAIRNEANTLKGELEALLLFKASVDKLVLDTIEVTFNANSNYLCKTLSERSYQADEEVLRLQKEIQDLEQNYIVIMCFSGKFDKNENK